jgi:hypothetical protein
MVTRNHNKKHQMEKIYKEPKKLYNFQNTPCFGKHSKTTMTTFKLTTRISNQLHNVVILKTLDNTLYHKLQKEFSTKVYKVIVLYLKFKV